MVCGAAGDDITCQRIFTGKRRPTAKSLLYVTRDKHEAFNKFVITPDAERLITAFWPGDLALRLTWKDPAQGAPHSAVGNPTALVGHETGVLGELAQLTTVPLAATTANISGGPDAPGPGPAITVDEVIAFAQDIDVVIDGGICPLSLHLTIVDCTGPQAILSRSGVVSDRAVAAVLTS
jgi:L-threonylcarbamoyladenylate synthase